MDRSVISGLVWRRFGGSRVEPWVWRCFFLLELTESPKGNSMGQGQ